MAFTPPSDHEAWTYLTTWAMAFTRRIAGRYLTTWTWTCSGILWFTISIVVLGTVLVYVSCRPILRLTGHVSTTTPRRRYRLVTLLNL